MKLVHLTAVAHIVSKLEERSELKWSYFYRYMYICYVRTLTNFFKSVVQTVLGFSFHPIFHWQEPQVFALQSYGMAYPM